MGSYKKFTDVCGGFAVFSAVMFLLREFMSYKPDAEETLGLLDKLRLFFTEEPIRDYYLYLPLLALLLFSLLLSLLFKKAPYVGFAASLPPLVYTLLLFSQNRLYERPMLYVILTLLPVSGGLLACIEADRRDRGRRSALACDLACLMTAALCGYVLLRAPRLPGLTWGELPLFERLMYDSVLAHAPLWVFGAVAVACALSVLLRLLWRDLYFLDALLSLLPAAAVLYWWHTDRIPFHGAPLTALVLLCALSRLTVMLLCKPKRVSADGKGTDIPSD